MFRDLRRKDKRMDLSESIDLLEKADIGVLSTIGQDGYPYGVAINYIYYNDKIYFHCAKEGHKLDNILFSDKISFMVYDHVEIIGQALTTHYQSVVVFGRAKMIKARADILLALIDKYAQIDETKAKTMVDREIDVTGLVEIEIEHISGKIGNK